MPKQKRFLLCKERYPAFIGGYGSGKTHVGCLKGISLALINAPLPGMIVAPTYPALRDYTLRTLKELLNTAFDKPIPFGYHEGDKVITLFPPAGDRNRKRWDGYPEIWLRSGDNPDSLLGPTLAWAGIDEIAQQKRDIWGAVLSRVRDPRAVQSQVFATGTPDEHWVAELWKENPQPGYVLFQSSTLENIYIDDDYIRGLRSSHDEEDLERVVGGEFIYGGKGRAYKAFDRAIHITAKNPFDDKEQLSKHLPLLLCCDFNVDPCIWEIAQVKSGVVYVADEIMGRDTNTEEMAGEFLDKYRDWRGQIIVYGDAAGKARATSASKSDYEILHAAGLRLQSVPKTNPAVKDRIAAVKARLKNGEGVARLFVHPDCKELIKDFEWVKWQEGKSTMLDKSDGERTHASDALGYMIYREYPVISPRVSSMRTAEIRTRK